ncbi:MAG: HPr family phosphocarrier protein [Myxococcota bacterium]
MPECYFRVDPRLVHATVTNAWVPELRISVVMVVDDEVVRDRRRQVILSMSAMEEVSVVFVGPDEAAKALSGVESDQDRGVLVLFSRLSDVARAFRAGLELDELNVGHLPAEDGRSAMHPAVFLGSQDLSILHDLSRAGTRVYIQPLPNDPPISPMGIPRMVQVKRPRRKVDPMTSVPAQGTTKAEGQLEVVNERGLHLRAAHALAHASSRYDCEIRVGREGQMVNAKSLLGLTTLGAAQGSRLTVEVVGPNADGVLSEIRQLFASGFYEGGAS